MSNTKHAAEHKEVFEDSFTAADMADAAAQGFRDGVASVGVVGDGCGPAETHCATCSCTPGMTPAIRFDTTPAERDGVVRDHLIRMGWTPPAEAQAQARPEKPAECADGCPERQVCDHCQYPSGPDAEAQEQGGDEAWLLDPRTVESKAQWDAVARALGADVDDPDAVLAAAKAKQASAPVGVEGHVHPHVKSSGCHCIQCRPLERPCDCVGCRDLAQQPAADGGFTAADMMDARQEGRKEAQQLAAVDDLNAWRAAFIAERAMRYREGGMAIEQARIHAETDAECIDADALAAQQGGVRGSEQPARKTRDNLHMRQHHY